MLTPDFQLKQDENTLTIIIIAPHARVSVLPCYLLNGFAETPFTRHVRLNTE